VDVGGTGVGAGVEVPGSEIAVGPFGTDVGAGALHPIKDSAMNTTRIFCCGKTR